MLAPTMGDVTPGCARSHASATWALATPRRRAISLTRSTTVKSDSCVAGSVAQLANVETVGGQVTNLKVSLETYLAMFWMVAWWAIGLGVVLLLLSPLIKRWAHGVS